MTLRECLDREGEVEVCNYKTEQMDAKTGGLVCLTVQCMAISPYCKQ